jgi:predicted nucleic acid-binding protein
MTPEKLLPDTCAWIDFFKGSATPLAQALERELLQGEVATCGVILCELVQGIRSTREEQLVLNALQAVRHLEMTAELWIRAGRLSARLRKNGHTLPLSDLIIATLALEHGLSVLTVDRHFDVVPGLRVHKGAGRKK